MSDLNEADPGELYYYTTSKIRECENAISYLERLILIKHAYMGGLKEFLNTINVDEVNVIDD